MELKTKKGTKLEEVKIDGKQIYVYLNSGSILEVAKKAKSLEEDNENVEAFLEMAKLLFKEDYELVSELSIEDFYKVMEIATKYIENVSDDFNKKDYTEKFRVE